MTYGPVGRLFGLGNKCPDCGHEFGDHIYRKDAEPACPTKPQADAPSSAATTGPLLPCPFCGSKPVRFWTSDYQQLAQVRCENDDCFGPSTPVASARDADRMWNRRISVPAQPTRMAGGDWAQLLTLRDVMKTAYKRGGDRLMSVWERDLNAIEAAIMILDKAARPPAAPVEPYIYGGDGRSDAVETDADLPTCQDVRGILPRSSAASAPPRRLCSYCKTWNSEPCGDQCCLSPDDPTEEVLSGPQEVAESYRETVQKVSAAREKGYAAARANLQEAWAAMALIREAVETLGPVGAVPSAEHLDGPTFMHEAEAIVNGIQALAHSRPQGKTP
jgi:hypothetical protein